MKSMFKAIASYMALFTSASTLICCALPSLFVLLGAGAVFASLLEVFPFLIVMSEHKITLFTAALVALIITGLMRRYAADQSCPTDPVLAAACRSSRRLSDRIYLVSCACLIVGGFVTFVLPVML